MTKNPRFFTRFLIFLLIFVLALGSTGCNMVSVKVEPAPDDPENPVITPPEEEFVEGYLSAAALGSDFVACGTDGRLDSISAEGEVTSLDSGTL